MVKFEFYLSDEDTDRLFKLKESQKEYSDLTGGEYAKMLLVRELRRLHPNKKHDEEW